MRSIVASLCTSLVVVGCQTPLPSERKPKSAGDPAASPSTTKATVAMSADAVPPDSELVTEQVLKMNAPGNGRPPNKFRTGHVVKRATPKAVSTATGFEVKFGAAMITTPTVYDHKVIVSGGFNSKELYAFEAKSGKPVWGISLDDDGPSNPACEQGVCVINTESCTIFALDASTGEQLWSWWLGDPLTSSPTIAGGRVFTSFPAGASADGTPRPDGATHVLAAFDLRKGTQLWDLWLDSDVMSAPVAVGEFVYVTTFAGTVIKLEQATGVVRYAMKAEATSAPVVQFQGGVESMYYTRRGDAELDGAEEMIIRADHNSPKTRYKAAQKKADYIDARKQAASEYSQQAKTADTGNGFGGGAPASANAGQAAKSIGVSSVSSMQGFQGSRVLQMGKRNVNTMGDEVIATDADSGTVLWKQKLTGDAQAGGFLGTAPVPAGNTVLYATLSGEVQQLDAGNGKLLTSYKIGGRVRSQPVTADGWIYVGTDDGRLVAIDTKDKSVDGWPTWGGNAQRTGVSAVAGK
jgi:outer membrane protein assembly factor BamB